MPVKPLDLARARLLVEGFGVARFTDFQGRADVDLGEGDRGLPADGRGALAVGGEGRNQRSDHDEPGFREELGGLGGATDVLGAILGGKS